MASDDTDEAMAEYRAYIDHRKALIASEQQQATLFDRSAITLSSGALALSITFIRSIVGPAPHTLYLLYLAWASLIAALLFTLISFRLSVHAHQRERELLDAKYLDGTSDSRNSWSNWVDRASTSSLFLIVLGVAALSSFVARNSWSPPMNDASPLPPQITASPSDLGKGIKPAPAPAAPRPSPGTGVKPAPPPPPPPKKN